VSTQVLTKHLIDNAIDFLDRAIDDFKDHPKYSVINFYTAVELFLKARLLHQDWLLVAVKPVDFDSFQAGDFSSVSFDEACKRLRKEVNSPIPDQAKQNFNAIRKHRNKMVHFFHEADDFASDEVSAIAAEQLRAWYDLNKLLTAQWRDVFNTYSKDFLRIERRLSGHREYLRTKYLDLQPQIAAQRANGVEVRICSSCCYEAVVTTGQIGNLVEAACLVCRLSASWFEYVCPSCSQQSDLDEGGSFTCPHCGHHDDEAAIGENINQLIITHDNYFDDHTVPANCTECSGHRTVVEYESRYLCIACFTHTETLESCDWCGEHNNGDMEGSAVFGCGFCDGRIGWERD